MLSTIRTARIRASRTSHLVCLTLLSFIVTSIAAFAADSAILRGTVRDPLGAVVAGATVELLAEPAQAKPLATALTDANGAYALPIQTSGRYRIRANAATFQPTASDSFFLSVSHPGEQNITLSTATQTETVTVTATGTPTPEAQVAAPVYVLSAEDYRTQPQIQDVLRVTPGAQITETGQIGGTTALFLRGGNSNANKLLVDGVPVDDIGGAVEYANIATVGIDRIEVLREPNSALYGSDALAGVVNLTTARGSTPLPLFTYTGDAGNFRTYRNEISAGGAYRKFDYYSAFARMDTQNNLPNDGFHDGTYAGNFGWQPNAANDFRFTVRHLEESGGSPNAILLYGIADDAARKEQDTVYNAAWNNQTTDRWHNQIRYGGLRLRYQVDDYAPTGINDLANSGNYLGKNMTICGANGYCVTGQAYFQSGYSTYPNSDTASTDRDFVYAQTDYRVNAHIVALGAFKYEAERGSTVSPYSTSAVSRGNYSYTLQVAGELGNRFYYTLGSGLEDNGLFGFAATPRASLAYYLVRPSASRWLSGTKLHGSFGKGIKEPSIYYQENSLYGVLIAQPNGQQLIAQYGVSPIGPENSRTFDGGIDQEIANGRARVGIGYFHNEFTNGVEYVPQNGLVALGVAAQNLPEFQYGAAVNSEAFRAQGVEFTSEYRVNSHLFARGGYTYLDAVVQRSFQSDPLCPACSQNPSIPGVDIGAYSPLIGARPFRRAPHTGYFSLEYAQSKWNAALTGSLVGKRDDSDFLSDPNFGNTLLLPNRNLDGSYERLDLTGGYQWTHALSSYVNVQNLLSEHYVEAFGYPALPLTFRAGLKLTFGGESWKLK
jgi:iron complex outermembrane receptor protein/vitamin B12 transporter